jgi:hypothetical protein
MLPRWHTAKHCRIALASLLSDINAKRRRDINPSNARQGSNAESPTNDSTSGRESDTASKRRRLNGTSENTWTTNRMDQSAHAAANPIVANQAPLNTMRLPGIYPEAPTSVDLGMPPAEGLLEGINFPQVPQVAPENKFDGSARPSEQVINYPLGMYSSWDHGTPPRGSESGWSNPMLGEQSAILPDQYIDESLLRGFDFNMSDVFEGATWENLMAYMSQDSN